MDAIKTKWDEFVSVPYPKEGHVEELDLEDIDGTISGCVMSFLGDAGRLSIDKKNILAECISALNDGMPKIPVEAQDYFVKLKAIGESVLREVKVY